jgi:hypothetical protein
VITQPLRSDNTMIAHCSRSDCTSSSQSSSLYYSVTASSPSLHVFLSLNPISSLSRPTPRDFSDSVDFSLDRNSSLTLSPLSHHSLATLTTFSPLSHHSLATLSPISRHSLTTLSPFSHHSLTTLSRHSLTTLSPLSRHSHQSLVTLS